MTDTTTTISDADVARFRETCEREMAEAMAVVLEPSRVRERLERERAERERLGWPKYVEKMRRETQAKVAGKARKTRAATTTKATINRHIDIALARGLPVTGILPDGTVSTGGVNSAHPVIDNQAAATATSWDDV